MWFKKFLGVFVTFGLVLAACSGGGTTPTPGASGSAGTSTQPAANQVLRVDLGGEPPTLDPTQATDSQSINVLRSITRPLAYFDKDLQVVPGLAESWDINSDGTQITFHLKDGIKYSDGSPIVAGDFVYSWKRLIDPREAAGYSYVMADVKGGDDLLGVDTETANDADITALLDKFGVSAPDDKTFVVDLAQPGELLRLHRHPVGHRAPEERFDLRRGRRLRRLRPDEAHRVEPPVEHRAQAERELHRRPRADDLRDRHEHDPGSGRDPRRLRGG